MVVLQLRAQFPGRPIVLMGWSVGALIASQVSLAIDVQLIYLLCYCFNF